MQRCVAESGKRKRAMILFMSLLSLLARAFVDVDCTDGQEHEHRGEHEHYSNVPACLMIQPALQHEQVSRISPPPAPKFATLLVTLQDDLAHDRRQVQLGNN